MNSFEYKNQRTFQLYCIIVQKNSQADVSRFTFLTIEEYKLCYLFHKIIYIYHIYNDSIMFYIILQ